jgi:hypothetical protein
MTLSKPFSPLASVMLKMKFMNSSNPFQIPSCFQVDPQRRRRERFKKIVFAIVAGIVLLLVGLLIEGCVSEHAKAVTPPASPASL